VQDVRAHWPILSVIVVNWNTCDRLRACLSCLAACRNDDLGSIEVFVVDNASTDGSAAMVRSFFPWVTLLLNETNVGFACANNQAIRQSHGNYLLLLNSDAEVLPQALATLVDFMAKQARVGAVGPRLLNSDGSLQPSTQPMLTPEREFWRLSFLDHMVPKATYRMHDWDGATPRQVDVLKGACLLLRREALDEIGLLDDSYFMYTEEVDLCYRLAESGWQIWWLPRARVVHHGEASSSQVAEQMYIELYRSKVQFFRKVGGEKLAKRFKRLVRLAYLPRAIAAAALARTSHSAATTARAQVYRRLLSELARM
jgi:GT2 family glycosyltransferase